jgi:hypothetical protein
VKAELPLFHRPIPRAIALLVFVVLLAAGLAAAGIELVIASRPPADVAPRPPVTKALTGRLALVIIDGLRHELAQDAEVMPRLAARMAASASGEIWASPVSMTSSAVLTYATGQRGDIDQIVNNETGRAVEYDHLVRNVKSAGLVTAFAGDRAWLKMYGDSWDRKHPDPYGVGIEVDFNAEIFEAAYTFLKEPPRPHFAVFHFVTPDHQAHAYGTTSARYRAHLRSFDELLDALLGAIPPDTTVFVTSDHGATDTGTHGSDTPIQRRSPLLAYGPGIVAGRKEPKRLEQIDLAGTLAVLLGVSIPAESRGHVLVDWLELPDETRALVACDDLARLVTYVSASGLDDARLAAAKTACDGAEPRARVDAARSAAAALDEALTDSGVTGSRYGFVVPLLGIFGALGIAWGALGLRLRRHLGVGSLVGLAVIGLSLALTYGVELLPGDVPNAVRIALYVLANGVLLYGLVRPRQSTAFLDRAALWGAVLLPGLVVVTPTRVTQGQGYALAAVIGLFALTVGLPRAKAQDAPGWFRALARPRVGFAIVLLLAFVPLSYQEADFLPKLLRTDVTWMLVAALVTTFLFALERHLVDPKARPALTALGFALAVASLYLRRVAPASVCLALWVASGVATLLLVRRAPRSLVELVGLASYAWVSRDYELPILLASYVLAAAVGDAFGRDLARDGQHAAVRPSAVLAIVTFVFGWTFVQRIGVQGGVDFVHMDWGAGGFREGDVSMLRVGAGIGYKHLLARGSVLFAVLVALPRRYRDWVARGVLVAEGARVATQIGMLYFCRDSFWTAMRVIGDAPHALIAVLGAAIAHLLVVRDEGRGARPESVDSKSAPAEGAAGGAIP